MKPTCAVSYQERLKILNIYSLERRRERYQILYIYKIIIELVQNPGFLIDYHPRTKIRVEPKYQRRASTWVKTVRNNSFFYTGPKLFNSLPQRMKELPDTTKNKELNYNTFKADDRSTFGNRTRHPWKGKFYPESYSL